MAIREFKRLETLIHICSINEFYTVRHQHHWCTYSCNLCTTDYTTALLQLSRNIYPVLCLHMPSSTIDEVQHCMVQSLSSTQRGILQTVYPCRTSPSLVQLFKYIHLQKTEIYAWNRKEPISLLPTYGRKSKWQFLQSVYLFLFPCVYA